MQFQCDGGGEFTSAVFINHLAQHGIRQLMSCPNTPQQNGLAERKHKHITELGLTMMYHRKVPHHLCVEAFFMATFLGNLLPSSVLSAHKSPYEALYGKPPIYSSLKTFGCKCFPYLRPYMKNKMDPKSLACVFIGYNEKYKGYRCLYPPTRRVFISRHVLFDEFVFPFEDAYSQYHKPADSALLTAWRSATLKQPVPPSPIVPTEEVFPSHHPSTINIGTIPIVLPQAGVHVDIHHQEAQGDISSETNSENSSTDSDQEAP